MDFRELITVDELADRLKVRKSWVYGKTMYKGPDAISRIQAGKYLRFDYALVIEWLERRTLSAVQ